MMTTSKPPEDLKAGDEFVHMGVKYRVRKNVDDRIRSMSVSGNCMLVLTHQEYRESIQKNEALS